MNSLGTESNIQHVADIVSAFVSNNAIPHHSIGDLIASVAASLDHLGKGPIEIEAKLVPAVPIKKSIHHEYLISLETGQKFRTLKRHLLGLGMTPEQYRTKWNLPSDYPMVAQDYSAKRSELARQVGLGNFRPPDRSKAVKAEKVPGKRVRPRKDAA